MDIKKAQTSPYSPTGLRQPSINYGKPALMAQAPNVDRIRSINLFSRSQFVGEIEQIKCSILPGKLRTPQCTS